MNERKKTVKLKKGRKVKKEGYIKLREEVRRIVINYKKKNIYGEEEEENKI